MLTKTNADKYYKMKIKILVFLTLVSMSCFSQSIGGLKIDNAISSNPLKVQFSVYQKDSVFMNLYDRWGNVIKNILPKDLYEAGTYKIEYTLAEHLKTDTYIYQLISSDKRLSGNLLFIDFIGSAKSSDKVKITYLDTTNILIIDTLNCVKKATNLRNYETFPISESLIFHDNLKINFSGVDNLVLYDLSGKFIRRLIINSNLIHLQDLNNGIYVGLFYEKGDIIKTIKMIKE